MYKDASGYIDKILELLNEIDSYNYYKAQLVDKLDAIFAMYQRGEIDSIRYDALTRKILKGKTKKDILNYYDSYIRLLLKQIQNNNTLIVDSIYYADIDDVMAGIKIGAESLAPKAVPKAALKAVPKAVPKAAAEKVKEKILAAEKPAEHPAFIKPAKAKKPSFLQIFINLWKSLARKLHLWRMRRIQARADRKRENLLKADIKKKGKQLKQEAKRKAQLQKAEAKKKAKIKPLQVKLKKVSLAHIVAELFKPKPKAEKKLPPEKAPKKKPVIIPKKGFFARLADKIRLGFRKEKIKKLKLIPKEYQVGVPEEKGIKKISIRKVFEMWLNRLLKKREYLGEETLISPSLIRLADVSLQEFQKYQEVRTLDPEHLLREAKKIKGRLAKQKATPIYRPILIGSIANVTVRKFTNYLIGKFPGFFKNLYLSLRLANIQVLSNTYANIMVFFMVIIYAISFLAYTIFAILAFQPLFVAIIFGIVVASICTIVAGFAFYFYPNTKIASRIKNIKTNLPFAINHIAAIASSGVPPVAMFKLVSESMEYGEVCIELHKVIDYIELFGYDLVTAVRSVAALTPEEDLREFFEGMINTIESGGEFEKYLMAKSKETMSSYEIERKKYAETVSTYSDIYTGILIAAPLFFVAALTLVSMLGGQVGGMDVSVIIGVGTYLVIPILNIAFIIFLNISQPEI